MNALGITIKQKREQKNLTQEALAEASGVRIEHISRIERGFTKKPRIDTLIALADALGVTVDDFTGQERANSGEENQPVETDI